MARPKSCLSHRCPSARIISSLFVFFSCYRFALFKLVCFFIEPAALWNAAFYNGACTHKTTFFCNLRVVWRFFLCRLKFCKHSSATWSVSFHFMALNESRPARVQICTCISKWSATLSASLSATPSALSSALQPSARPSATHNDSQAAISSASSQCNTNCHSECNSNCYT